MNAKIKLFGLLMPGLFLIVLSAGCKKMLEIPAPVTSLSDADVYSTDATATSVLTGLYVNISQGGGSGFTDGGYEGTALLLGLAADELTLYSGANNMGLNLYYTNALNSSDEYVSAFDFWSSIYQVVYTCNAAIEGVNASTSLTPAVKQQLLGEAKFMRAFCYFYLTALYGDVPLVTSTNYAVNRLLPRTPKATVYQQIITDLQDAEGHLSSNYVDASLVNTTMERVRPTKWAAAALLARTYLYTEDWAGADSAATAVINNSTLYSLDSLNSVFLSNSSEAIWQLQPVGTETAANTTEGREFILTSTGPNTIQTAYVSNNLLDSFETGDERKADWIDSVVVNNVTYYYPYKYKVGAVLAPVTEYSMVLRLGEQYLIRSEALANQGNISGAQTDLNVIRTRAGLPNTTAASPSALLAAILHERQLELFTEWGQRWLDLKRTGQVNAVMTVATPQKGGTWNTNMQLFPIQLYDLQHDPQLVQNEGY